MKGQKVINLFPADELTKIEKQIARATLFLVDVDIPGMVEDHLESFKLIVGANVE